MASPVKKTIPWVLLLEAAAVLREHWQSLEPADRQRLTALLSRSRGMPHKNLTPAERRELTRIVKQLDLVAAGRRLAPIGRSARGARLGRRRP